MLLRAQLSIVRKLTDGRKATRCTIRRALLTDISFYTAESTILAELPHHTHKYILRMGAATNNVTYRFIILHIYYTDLFSAAYAKLGNVIILFKI